MVVGVHDGDTITVLTSAREQVTIRLYGVDCPELGQVYGDRAKRYTHRAVYGKAVNVEVMTTDRYGRTVALITTEDGLLLNQALIEAGMAWVYEAYCRMPQCADWRALEAEARAGRLGLWSMPGRMPPWEYRKEGL